MSEAEVMAEQAKHRADATAHATGSFGIGLVGFTFKALLFWLLVGIPLAWGVWITIEKALVLFR
jgi:hypothetical protein